MAGQIEYEENEDPNEVHVAEERGNRENVLF